MEADFFVETKSCIMFLVFNLDTDSAFSKMALRVFGASWAVFVFVFTGGFAAGGDGRLLQGARAWGVRAV
jgi:hypothetical protein